MQDDFEIVSRSDGAVCYGHVIFLKHCETEKYLASNDEQFSGGSKQHKVFTADGPGGDDQAWLVMHPHKHEDSTNEPVTSHDEFILKHVGTRRNLHSHENVQSAVSRQQEATAYSSKSKLDRNDLWRIELVPKARNCGCIWRIGSPVHIYHVATNATLHSHALELHAGLNEVTGFRGPRDLNDRWEVPSA